MSTSAAGPPAGSGAGAFPVEDVGIVGFGRCGRLAAEVMSTVARVVVTDRVDRAAEAAALGVQWGDLDGVARRPAVVLAVPIRALPDVLDAVAPRLARGALVVDLASVKERPLAWMAERLPDHARPVGTHPLFGPESARREGVQGRRIVICAAPRFEAAAAEVETAARALGLAPIRMDAEDHDRDMARSQALLFLLSRAMGRAGIGPAEHGTSSEEHLWSALSLVKEDTEELYEDILRLNAFALETGSRLAAAIQAEIDRLARPPGSRR